MSHSERYCPLCRGRQTEVSCPVHGIPTIAASVVGAGAAELAPGTVLAGRFRVEGLLGKGGMGQVYRAVQLSIQRAVAVKTLHPRLLQDPNQLGRFYREAQAASLLEGPHIVRVYDFGVDEPTSTPFIAMELVRGATLRERVGHSPLWPGEAAAIAAQICRALAEAHGAGIVHRDLKSENILLTEGPLGPHSVRVMDFGIAKLDRERHGETGSLTASGALLGTPRTMAPEQILGEPVDARTDLYALGCVLHEMLTGSAPFRGDDPISIINQHLLAAPPVLDPRLGVPPALVRLRDALMAKSRDQRPCDAATVARQLDALASAGPAGAPGDTSPDADALGADTLVGPGVEAAGARGALGTGGRPLEGRSMGRGEAPDATATSSDGLGLHARRGRRRLVISGLVAASATVALVVALTDWGRAPSPSAVDVNGSGGALLPGSAGPSIESDESPPDRGVLPLDSGAASERGRVGSVPASEPGRVGSVPAVAPVDAASEEVHSAAKPGAGATPGDARVEAAASETPSAAKPGADAGPAVAPVKAAGTAQEAPSTAKPEAGSVPADAPVEAAGTAGEDTRPTKPGEAGRAALSSRRPLRSSTPDGVVREPAQKAPAEPKLDPIDSEKW